MAYIKLYRDKLRENYNYLDRLFKGSEIKWGITTKLLCGHEAYLREVAKLGIGEMHDSRISNLKKIKKLDPDVLTIYIKPPPKDILESVVRYADVSLNTELSTLHALSEEAKRQGKTHKVIIMIEMGDLREGVMRDDLIDFYEKVFELPHVEVIGLGTNLNCMHGVMPDEDKLIQLALYKNIIELRFDRTIPLVSGGTTVTIPLLLQDRLPKGINHFRVGEALFFGKNLFTGGTIDGMHEGVMELYSQIIEISKKPKVPSGELGVNPQGDTFEVDKGEFGKSSYRAILDIGYLDINPDHLICIDEDIEIADASSDMLVLDVGENDNNYEVGDYIRFRMKYMGALGIMNSDYIDKVVE
ncbi:MAG: alanine/ornithine racemase family PLP-dependent enzyme [Balneolaceae bacterium]|nr:alanine/ornithine racemase family PLP-dependent enzyme [Balneolaceae bacterium]